MMQFLADRGARYVSSVRLVEDAGTVILEVPRSRLSDTAGKGMTSRRQLAQLRSAITRRFELRVVITFQAEELLADVEAGLRALLERNLPGKFSNLAVSFPTSNSADVWGFMNENGTNTEVESVRALIEQYLKEAKFSSINVQVSGAAKPQPSLVAILRSVKTHAPAELSQLLADLDVRGFGCPSDRWLSAKLDAARKSGLVIRSQPGKYTLSLEGLSAVPVSTRKTSSDIDRVLALARRKQW